VEKLVGIIQKIREQSGNPHVDSLELMGGSSRIPAIENLMRENFPKKEGSEEEVLARSLILQDPVARGCALVAAQCSPLFRLFEFNVQDTVVHPVAFSWLHLGGNTEANPDEEKEEEEGSMHVDEEAGAAEEKTMTLFEKNSPNPSSKLVTFQRKETFELNSAYVCPEELSPGSSPFIGKFTVSGLPEGKMSKVKVKIRMDQSSVIVVESAEMVETEYYEVEEPVAPAPAEEQAPAPAEEQAPAAEEAPAADAPEGQEEAAPAAEDAEMAPPEEAAPAAPEAPKMEKKRKKKTKRTPLVVSSQTWAYTEKDLQEKIEGLLALESADRLIHDTQDRKNAVESYVYAVRDGLDMHLKEFVKEDDRVSLQALLLETEDWLYGDGENATKSEYIEKLKSLEAFGNPITVRHKEQEMRPKAVDGLQHAIESARSFVASTDEKYEHIGDTDRAQVSDMADEHAKWLNEMVDAQGSKPTYEDPAFLAKDCDKKAKELQEITTRKANIPKPAPPKEEKEEKEEKKEGEEGAKPEEGEDPDKEDEASMPDLADESAPADPAADMEID
jgi:molecular chaperone DnaK (HSP70)